MKSFLSTFDKEYAGLLNPKINWVKRGMTENFLQRSQGFRIIFDLLETKNNSTYNILETGTLRNKGQWKDGQSSFLFQEFIKHNNGHLFSVDLNPVACDQAKIHLDSNICSIHCGDSVEYLTSNTWNDFDLFYLDSYDVKWDNPIPSAEHHLKEFKVIERYLKEGTVVAIDDNDHYNGSRTGKGLLIYEYLKNKGIMPLYDGYQIIYKF